jgi:activator of 2-hydroxyglutaryl-CoA dehydratase
MTAAAIGLDAGSTTTKLVAVDAAGEVLWRGLSATRSATVPEMVAA